MASRAGKSNLAAVKAKSRSQPDLYKLTVDVNTKTAPYVASRVKTTDEELFEICSLSGVSLDIDVFKIILDLIRLNVNPNTIADVLKKMASNKVPARKDVAKGSESTNLPRYGSDNTKQGRKPKSSLTIYAEDAKQPKKASSFNL